MYRLNSLMIYEMMETLHELSQHTSTNTCVQNLQVRSIKGTEEP